LILFFFFSQEKGSSWQPTSPSSLIEKPKRGEAHVESNIWHKTHHKCCLLCGGGGGGGTN
jgi:hypothetical protein